MSTRKSLRGIGWVAGAALLAGAFTVPTAAQASTTVQNGTVIVHPDEYDGAIKNPLMGFAGKDFRVNTTGPSGNSDQPLDHLPWGTTMMTYIPWDALEDDASDTVDDMRAYLDERWRGKDSAGVWRSYEELGIKAIPRIYLRFPSSDPYFGLGGDHWPSDLAAGDFTSAAFDARLERMVERLAEVMDDDPRVAYIQMGIFGTWGEQHGTAMPANIEEYFNEYFHNKHVQVRYHHTGQWDDVSQFGLYNDGIGNLMTSANWADKPVGGEPAYDYNGFDIQGNLVRDTYLDEDLNSNSSNMIRSTHASYLTWIGEYTYGSSWGTRDADGRQVYLANKALIDDRAENLQQQFGYRYVMNEFRYPQRITPGQPFDVSFSVTNAGSAPMYYNWPVQVSLRDPATNQVVWSDTFDNVDITEWQPGSGMIAWNKRKDGNWSNGVLPYTTPAQPTTESGTFTVPASLPTKDYVVQLAVLDPGGNVPSLRFAMENYTEGGYHPMGLVGVGKTPSTVAVDASTFDSPAVDVSLRYYREGQTPSAPALLSSLQVTGTPVALAKNGQPFDLGNLRLLGKDSAGRTHVLDAASPTWTITSGAAAGTLNGSVLQPTNVGTVKVAATFNGATSNSFSVTVTDQVGNLSGTVKDDVAASVSGAKVTVTGSSGTFETTSAANGTYSFQNLPVGSYSIAASRANFTNSAVSASITKAQTLTKDLTLQLTTGGNFTDDFADGAGDWTAGTGTWSVASGKYAQTKVGGSNAWRYSSAITGKLWRDATYEADISYTNGADWAGLMFRKSTQAGTVNDTGYMVHWGKDGTLQVKKAGSTITTLASVQLGTDWSQQHKLKVVNSGTNIVVYVDGGSSPVLSVTDSTYKYGYAGVGTAGSVWAFDNVKVTQP